MVQTITDFIFNIFGDYSWIAVIVIAMLPIVELRGAIPIACAIMPLWKAYLLAAIGSTIPALVIIPFLIPLFRWLKSRKFSKAFAQALEKRFKAKSKNLQAEALNETNRKKKNRIKFFGVMLFVAIPLPLTGAWTGAAIAAYLGLDYKKAVLAILFGNVIAGAIMSLVCSIFAGREYIVLLAFLALAVFIGVGMLVIKLLKKHNVVVEVDGEVHGEATNLQQSVVVEDAGE